MKVRYPGPAVTDPDAQRVTFHTALGKLEGGKEYEFHPVTIKPYVKSGLFVALEPFPREALDPEELAELDKATAAAAVPVAAPKNKATGAAAPKSDSGAQ